MQRVGVQAAARVQDVRSASANLLGAPVADGDHRGCSVAEQCGPDQTRHGWFDRGIRQRAKLNRDQNRDVVGRATQVVAQAGHARRPCHAAQTEQRHPPHVGAQTKPPGDPGIQRRHRDAGDGCGGDHVDVAGAQVGIIERAQQGLDAKVDSLLDKDLVGVAEVGQRRVLLQRQHQVSTVDLGGGMQTPNDLLVFLKAGKLDKRISDLTLAIAMRRQRTEHTRDDAHAPAHLSYLPPSKPKV
ncbi:Uncharacterised protein [Mycobacterium tuberculosis]|nr:Uncharacterised protein [Mycobacterium tuberculosis]